jgi:hypothetical protein
LVVPFLAILTFVDPSVEFGLRFEQNEDDEQPKFSEMEKENDQENKSSKKKGDVVSLDSFRK